MKRGEAVSAVQALFRTQGMESPGLNEKGFGGIMMGTMQLYFEYREASSDFVCRAHIYSFRMEPRPGVLEGLAREEKGGAPTGGGVFEYMPENKGIYLSRTYKVAVDDKVFVSDMHALGEASLVWSKTVLPRVFATVRTASPSPR